MLIPPDMYFEIIVFIITGLLALIGWILRGFVQKVNADSEIFRSSFSDIRVILARLDSYLPDINKCESDLKDLEDSHANQWKKINEHEVKIKHLEDKP